ncbi:T9SS type B sorting domain-containing protein [Flavobacterium akiainvivens]|nr:T9SS type B sorting domain-containing protein [Flavobacterium akiainvivens]
MAAKPAAYTQPVNEIQIEDAYLNDCMSININQMIGFIDMMRINAPYATLAFYNGDTLITGANYFQLIGNMITIMQGLESGTITVVASEPGYPDKTVSLFFNLGQYIPNFVTPPTPLYTPCLEPNQVYNLSQQEIKSHLQQFLVNGSNLTLEINMIGGFSILNSGPISFQFRVQGESCWSHNFSMHVITVRKPDVDVLPDNNYTSNCENTFTVTEEIVQQSFGATSIYFGYEIKYNGVLQNLGQPVTLDFSVNDTDEIVVEFYYLSSPDCRATGILSIQQAAQINLDTQPVQDYLDNHTVSFCDAEDPTPQVQTIINYIALQYPGVTIAQSVDDIVAAFTNNNGQVAINLTMQGLCGTVTLLISYAVYAAPVIFPINTPILYSCGTFDLTLPGEEAFGNQDTNVYAVTYYTTETAATAGNTNSEFYIAAPNAYTTTLSSQQIWIRIENTGHTNCYATAVFSLQNEQLLQPQITVAGTNVLCVDYNTGQALNTVDLVAGTQNNNIIYNWYKDGILIPGATWHTYTANEPGSYTAAATLQQAPDCISQPSAAYEVITSGPAVPIGNGFTATPFDENGTVEVLVNGYGQYAYSVSPQGPWQDTTVFSGLTAGVYNVYVKDVTPGSGCGLTVIENIPVIFYRKFFTPNNDGVNDFWYIDDFDAFANCTVYIFDRYGKLLKELYPKSSNWDKKAWDGNNMPAGDYWFSIIFIYNGSQFEYKSHFSLIR